MHLKKERERKKKKANTESFCIVTTHNPAKFGFPTLNYQRAKVRRRNVTAFARTSSFNVLFVYFHGDAFVSCFVTTSFQENELMNLFVGRTHTIVFGIW